MIDWQRKSVKIGFNPSEECLDEEQQSEKPEENANR